MNMCNRKLVFAALVFCSALSPGWLQAQHVDGYVDVTTVSNGAPIRMQGTINVRYNAALPNAWMGASGSINGPITFSGMDEEGDFFSCTVSILSRMYPVAVRIRNNLTNGASLLVTKPYNRDSCTDIRFSHSSTLLD